MSIESFEWDTSVDTSLDSYVYNIAVHQKIKTKEVPNTDHIYRYRYMAVMPQLSFERATPRILHHTWLILEQRKPRSQFIIDNISIFIAILRNVKNAAYINASGIIQANCWHSLEFYFEPGVCVVCHLG